MATGSYQFKEPILFQDEYNLALVLISQPLPPRVLNALPSFIFLWTLMFSNKNIYIYF